MSTHSSAAKEIFAWRLFPAVLWSVLIQLVFLCFYLLFLNFNIVHPVTWIKLTFSSVLRIKTWLYFFPLASVIFAMGIFGSKDYVNDKPFYNTRFSYIVNLISIRNATLGALHILSGGMTVWFYLSLFDGHYSNLSRPCAYANTEESCLVEGNVFLFAGGLWTGLYHFFKDHIVNPTQISFPLIQQRKFIQVKSSLNPLFKKAMKNSIVPTLCYALVYYLKGHVFRNTFIKIFKLKTEDEAMDGLFTILTSPLLIYAWFFSAIFLTSMYSISLLFNIFLTERYSFPIEGSNECMNLGDALLEGPDILMKLAAQDLLEMAYKDKTRRTQLFSLSIPGGHPTNWKHLYNHCLQIITTYCNDLNTIINDSKTPEVNNTSMSNLPPINEPLRRTNLRNLVANSPTAPYCQPQKEESFKKIVKNEFNLFLQVVRKKPGICYFFGELTELKLKWMVLKGQVVVKVSQALAQLVAASFTEDCFGVVQEDLPAIISALINLKQTFEKLTKTGIITKKKQEFGVMPTLTELKSATKRSIYKITVTFGGHIMNVPLEDKVYQALQPFINLRE